MSKVILKQHKDPVMQRTYSDCFILLTKHFYEQKEDKQVRECLIHTFKTLLTKFLETRAGSASGLSQRFFTQVFEQCPSLGWGLNKVMLRSFLTKGAESSATASPAKGEAVAEESKTAEDGGSRGNH